MAGDVIKTGCILGATLTVFQGICQAPLAQENY